MLPEDLKMDLELLNKYIIQCSVLTSLVSCYYK